MCFALKHFLFEPFLLWDLLCCPLFQLESARAKLYVLSYLRHTVDSTIKNMRRASIDSA